MLFLYSFRHFLLRPSFATSAFAASALALAQITKFTAAYLYPVVLVFVASALLYSKYGRDKRYRITKRQIGILLALHTIGFIAIINAAFLFGRTLTPLAKYDFRSTTFKAAQQIPFVRAIPLPVPYDYIQGFDLMSYHNATGLSFCNIVLLGNVRGPELARSEGFPAYYLVAYVLKEPLGTQLLLLLGLWWTARHRRLGDFLAGEWLLIVTAGVSLLMLSLFSNTQIGIRHILPVLVIFLILARTFFSGTGANRLYSVDVCSGPLFPLRATFRT